jgi:hypothetical protein
VGKLKSHQANMKDPWLSVSRLSPSIVPALSQPNICGSFCYVGTLIYATVKPDLGLPPRRVLQNLIIGPLLAASCYFSLSARHPEVVLSNGASVLMADYVSRASLSDSALLNATWSPSSQFPDWSSNDYTTLYMLDTVIFAVMIMKLIRYFHVIRSAMVMTHVLYTTALEWYLYPLALFQVRCNRVHSSHFAAQSTA